MEELNLAAMLQAVISVRSLGLINQGWEDELAVAAQVKVQGQEDATMEKYAGRIEQLPASFRDLVFGDNWERIGGGASAGSSPAAAWPPVGGVAVGDWKGVFGQGAGGEDEGQEWDA